MWYTIEDFKNVRQKHLHNRQEACCCGVHSACREENRHKMVFRQKCKLVTSLNLKMLFTSPLKVKGYALYSKLEQTIKFTGICGTNTSFVGDNTP